MAVTPRDRRDFTEAEYKRELELHHVKLEKGQSAGQIYRQQSMEIRQKPRSGVFRDFAEYGVHPARVVVQRPRLTIPLLLSLLTARQLAAEITNQKYRSEGRKTPETKWPEEEEAEKSELEMLGRQVRSYPSVDAAYELIKILNEKKSFVGWTPPLQQYMSALNLLLFRVGGPDKLQAKFFIPPRDYAIMHLTPLVLINRKIATVEIVERHLKDPSHWGITDPDRASVTDIANLIAELMTTNAYTAGMREIVGWFKTAYRRTQVVALIENILNHQEAALVTVRVGMR